MILHSSNVLWLISAVPAWYFSAIAHPLVSGIFTFIPSLGTVCLAIGIVRGFFPHGRALLLFLFSFLLSETYAAIAGSLVGRFGGNASLLPSSLFMLAQIALVISLVNRTRKARLGSAALAVFSLTYAFFTLIVGGMAFADSWL